MFNESLTRFYTQLQKYPVLARILAVLKKTPEPALHWYLILVVALIVTILNVGLAWVTFRGISTQKTDLFSQSTNASTISRDALQDAIKQYELRAVEFEDLKKNPPSIVDPGA